MDKQQAKQDMELLENVSKLLSSKVQNKLQTPHSRLTLRKVLSILTDNPYQFQMECDRTTKSIQLYWKDSHSLGMSPDIEITVVDKLGKTFFYVNDDRLWKTMAGLNEFVNERDTSGYRESPMGRIYYAVG